MSLDKYGKGIRRYNGIGQLKTNILISVIFDITQLSNGNILIECIADGIYNCIDGKTDLTGETNDGRYVYANCDFAYMTIEKETQKTIILLSSRSIQVGTITDEDEILNYYFSIANLDTGAIFSFILGNVNIKIVPANNFLEALDNISYNNGIEITHFAVVKAPFKDIIEILKTMQNLCYLLTLLHGHDIDWLLLDILKESSILLSIHKFRVIKPHSNYPLIATHENAKCEDFITTVYPNYCRLKDKYDLENIINELSDAKQNQDRIEFRGLKIVITLEHILCRYLEMSGKDFIIDNNTFLTSISSIMKKVRLIIQETYHVDDNDKLDIMACHVRGFNHYTFGRALSDLCKEINLVVNSTNRSKIKDIRDNLVHRAKYLDNEDPIKQYCFITCFLGRVIASMLGYRENCLDLVENFDELSKPHITTSINE